MSYEAGFQRGEHDAFRDRRNNIVRTAPKPSSDYERGYADAYTPRSLTWALKAAPVQAWWQERESVA